MIQPIVSEAFGLILNTVSIKMLKNETQKNKKKIKNRILAWNDESFFPPWWNNDSTKSNLAQCSVPVDTDLTLFTALCNHQMYSGYNDIFTSLNTSPGSPNSILCTWLADDGNKCVMVKGWKQINRLTFLLLVIDLLSYSSNYPLFIIFPLG